MGPLFELFQPSRRITDDQLKAERMLRDDDESGDPPFSVDLDAGVVVIRRPAAGQQDDPSGRAPDEGQSTR